MQAASSELNSEDIKFKEISSTDTRDHPRWQFNFKSSGMQT
uniref:Uncharacterized protein n=1 Tax=Rhizophora mucronata TaxID=61149 RepID=A0A2P2QCS7_RHIMU